MDQRPPSKIVGRAWYRYPQQAYDALRGLTEGTEDVPSA